MSFTESADDFLDLNDFAITSDYNSGTTVTGIFNREYVEVMGAESKMPTFTCELADVSGVNQGKALVIDGTSYTVRNVQPDESNFMVKLVLSEDDA